MDAEIRKNELAKSAISVRDEYREVLKILPGYSETVQKQYPKADLESAFEQFRVWTRNVGAFTPDEGSLDFRLKDHTVLHDFVSRTLRTISTELSYCCQLAAMKASHVPETSLLDMRATEETDKLSASGEPYAGRHSPLPDELKFLSDDVDDNHVSSETQRDELVDISGEIVTSLDDVMQAMNHLTDFAIRLRNSGRSSRITRAAHFKKLNEEGVDEIQAFREYLLPKVLENVSEPIRSRLIHAITARRQFFEYQNAHAKKLAYGFEVSNSERTGYLVTDNRKGQPAIPSENISISRNRPAALKMVTSTIDRSNQSILSGTAASGISSRLYKRATPSAIAPSVVSSTFRKHTNIPDPPPMAPGTTHFQCPHCSIQLPRQKREKSAWRSHVLRDLRPFVCLSQTCSHPQDHEFEDEEAWYNHQLEHVMKWTCDGDALQHDPIQYASKEEFAAHLKTHTKTNVSLEEQEMALKYSAQPSIVALDSCPFCDFMSVPTPSANQNVSQARKVQENKLASSGIQAKLKAHVLNHLQHFFTFALIRSEVDQDYDSDKKSGGPARGTIADLDNVQIITGDQEQFPHASNIEYSIPDCEDDGWLLILSRKYWEGYQPKEEIDHSTDEYLKDFIAAKMRAKNAMPNTGQETSANSLLKELDSSLVTDLKSSQNFNDQVDQSATIRTNLNPSDTNKEGEDPKGDIVKKFLLSLNRKIKNHGKRSVLVEAPIDGTCSWIWKKSEMQNWLSGIGPPTLAITGSPGTGKTVLAKYVSLDLRNRFPDALIVEYFNDQMRNKLDSETLLVRLFTQIFQTEVSGTENLTDEDALTLANYSNVDIETHLKILEKQTRMRPGSEVFIVVDGLDQCIEGCQAMLMTLVKLISRPTSCKLRIFMTSRLIQDATDIIGFVSSIAMERTETNRDINTYVQHFIFSASEDSSKENSALLESFSNRWEAGESNIQASFLVVASCLERLDVDETSEDLIEVAFSKSSTPSTFYQTCLAKIKEHETSWRLLQLMLILIIYTYEVLSVSAFAEACLVMFQALELNEEVSDVSALLMNNRLPLADIFLTVRDQKVFIRHRAALDYLMEEESEIFSLEASHLLILICTKQFLSIDKDTQLQERSFAYYAYQNFHYHLTVLSSLEPKMFTFFMPLLTSSSNLFSRAIREITASEMKEPPADYGHMLLWAIVILDVWQLLVLSKADTIIWNEFAFDLDKMNSCKTQSGVTPLMHAAGLGSKSIIPLISIGVDVEAEDDSGATALHFAVTQSQDFTVECLLEGKAFVDKQDHQGNAPLMNVETLSVAQMLLTHGADLSIRNFRGEGAIDYAAANDDYKVCELYLNRVDSSILYEHVSSGLHSAIISDKFNCFELLCNRIQDRYLNNLGNQGYNALHLAAYKTSTSYVLKLFHHDVDINQRARDGRTALAIAVGENNVEIARLLLQNGANANISNDSGWAPLHTAAEDGSEQMAKMLVEVDVDLEPRTSVGLMTPFDRACATNNVNVADILVTALRGKVNILDPPEDKLSALQIAASCNYLDGVERLLKHGANLEVKWSGGYTPLYVAIWKDHLLVARRLIDHGAVVSCDNGSGYTALHQLVKHGRLDYVIELINRDVNLNAVDKTQWTALHVAASEGRTDIAQILINNGISVSALNVDGRDALHIACFNGHEETAKLLLELGADPRNQTKTGWTCFISAAYMGHIGICKMLIDAGAEIGTCTRTANSALHLAAENGHTNIVELIVNHHMPLDLRNNDGNTPLLLALQANRIDTAEFLISRGTTLDVENNSGFTPLHEAARFGQLNLVKRFMDIGMSPLRVNKFGWTPITLALEKGHIDCVKILLDKTGGQFDTEQSDVKALCIAAGARNSKAMNLLLDLKADPNAVAYSPHLAYSAIYCAARAGNANSVRFLLEKGADVKFISNYGHSCLHAAVHSGSYEAVQVLLHHGVPLDVRSIGGYSALMSAAARRERSMVRGLIKAGADAMIVAEDGLTVSDMARHNPIMLAEMERLTKVPKVQDNNEMRLGVTTYITKIFRNLESLRDENTGLRLEMMQALGCSLTRVEDYDLATTIFLLASRKWPARSFAVTFDCSWCLKDISIDEEDTANICKTCIIITLCKSCFDKYDANRASDDRICSDHDFLLLDRSKWQDMEPEILDLGEKEEAIKAKWFKDMEIKYASI